MTLTQGTDVQIGLREPVHLQNVQNVLLEMKDVGQVSLLDGGELRYVVGLKPLDCMPTPISKSVKRTGILFSIRIGKLLAAPAVIASIVVLASRII